QRCSKEWSWSHSLCSQEILRCGTMVRRCGRSLWEFAFCTGGDVLAGCGALQGHERSRLTGQSRRGTSKHLSVQPVDEQVHSVAALIRIGRLAKIDSQPLPV